jgi:ribonuclease-3
MAKGEKDLRLLGLQKELGYVFSDRSLLVRCLTHVSYGQKAAEHNETLEFLGDAVLSLAVSDLLMRAFPEKNEGDLAEKAARLGLGAMLRMGKGEEHSGGREKESILAGAFEALLGGIYSDKGYGAVYRVVERYFAPDIKERRFGKPDFKTRLQEISQMMFHSPPVYRLVSESGPDHAKRFVTEIAVGGKVLGRGEGKSKKQSEQEAASKALEDLQGSDWAGKIA